MGMGEHKIVDVVAQKCVADKGDHRVAMGRVAAVDEHGLAIGQHHELTVALAHVDKVGGDRPQGTVAGAGNRSRGERPREYEGRKGQQERKRCV